MLWSCEPLGPSRWTTVALAPPANALPKTLAQPPVRKFCPDSISHLSYPSTRASQRHLLVHQMSSLTVLTQRGGIFARVQSSGHKTGKNLQHWLGAPLRPRRLACIITASVPHGRPVRTMSLTTIAAPSPSMAFAAWSAPSSGDGGVASMHPSQPSHEPRARHIASHGTLTGALEHSRFIYLYPVDTPRPRRESLPTHRFRDVESYMTTLNLNLNVESPLLPIRGRDLGTAVN